MTDSRPLRVAMTCGYRPTPAGGGTEKYVCELTNGLLARGVEVEIVCEDRPFLPDALNPHADRISGIAPEALQATDTVERFWQKSIAFAERIDATRYDIVHCHGQYAYHTVLRWAQRERRPRFVSTFHLTALGPNERYNQLGLGPPEEAPSDQAVAFMEQTIALLCDRCITVSNGVAREVVDLYGVPADRVEVISNWYDDSVFRPVDREYARTQVGLAADRTYLLYVGHFNMSRGRIMAQALRCLPADITLLVVHPEQDPLVLAEFGDRVRFIKHLQPDALALYFSAVDLLCFPSLYGGFGLVLLEAMACGCPPVVFDYPAMNEVVTPEAGYLVTEPTPAAYASAVVQALREKRAKSEAASRRALQFNMEAQIDAILNAYRRLIWQRSKPGRELRFVLID